MMPEDRIRASFAKQGLMTTLGATLGQVSHGAVEIAIRPNPAISQQHGFVHGGAVSAIADTAAGYATLSLMPENTGVLTTEFKIIFLRRRLATTYWRAVALLKRVARLRWLKLKSLL
jgi:uncharacterized protein (TIGR00369 family)